MTSDDFLREQVERSQREQTRRRREGRSRRRHFYWLGGLLAVAVLLLAAPSLISHSSIGRMLLTRAAQKRGLDATATSVRVGWITPLRITGLEVLGKSGESRLTVERLDTELTIAGLLGSAGDQGGQTVCRGVSLELTLTDGNSSLEQDLSELFNSSDRGGPESSIKLQDVTVQIGDTVAGRSWTVAQSSAELIFAADQSQATFAGVVSELGGSGGSLQGKVLWSRPHWEFDLESESLPLSIVSLVRRRLPELSASIPAQIAGEATGAIRLSSGKQGVIEASLGQLQIRNLAASDGREVVWANQLATIDGEFTLTDQRVFGRGLHAKTDFATATIDGSFDRQVSLTGSSDNPLRWLERLDGTATGEIDLAALDRALPGLLPLKNDVQLVSGRALLQLHSLPPGDHQRRSQLIVRSDPLRARCRGQAVVIDPISVKAIVANQDGVLQAEQFEWTSAFANAVGRGDLRDGSATIEIDFGRLSNLLRPLVEIPISETVAGAATAEGSTLAGRVQGKVSWHATREDVWRLSGAGDATGLVVALPGGKTLRRPSLHTDIEAVGRWGQHSLEELSQANVTLRGDGLDLRADLIRPVLRPGRSKALPIQVQGQGRIETLVETLAPWLPPQLQSAEGGYTVNARGQWSSEETTISVAAIELSMPRVAYANRTLSQPNVKIHFDGDYRVRSGRMQTQSMTVVGEAFSAAARGSVSSGEADLQVDWKASLERIQGSLQRKIAAEPPAVIRQVGYRPGEEVKSDQWLLMGDCEGQLGIKSQGDLLKLDTLLTATNVAIVQPPQASASYQTVGPMPGPRAAIHASAARVVWTEPNLRLDGRLAIDRQTGQIRCDTMNVAGDWFATDLSGRVRWDDAARNVQLNGPARLNMIRVAALLSKLAGADIRATGIQETELSIALNHPPAGELSLAVTGNLGWDSAQLAGFDFGPARIPVRLTETSVDVAATTIPVSSGQLRLAGQVHYRPGPLWMRVEPGVVAESIRLTPEMSDRWLKYVAPPLAQAARVDGTLSASLDEAIVVFDQPELSRVAGRLNIAGAQMTAGPLTSQIIGGIDQLKALAQARLPVAQPGATQTLITMPAQSVEFIVDSGVVTHERLFFEVDRAQIVTSGRVAFDGRLDMVAQVPLDRRWLGTDLQGLAGQPVTLPIDGTLSRPRLDSSGVRRVVTQLGSQAVQGAAENYLQQQLNRGLESIFGK